MNTAEPAQAPALATPPLLTDDLTGPDLAPLRELVRRVWGFDELRPFQAEAMAAALEGRDALVVLATGGGKSLCYQAPALLREGLTVVVSPLISLMKDQLDALVANGVAAAMLTSAQDGYEKQRVRELLAARELKLLFCAPERLLMPGFFEELEDYGLAALVIDEAHCISHWGHDFRPEYRKLGELRRGRVDLPCQAFTATATPEVQADIAAQLGLQEPQLLVGNFDRPNLTYRFLPRSDVLSQTLAVIRRHATATGGAGIVYCLRRKDVDKLSAEIAAEGIACVPYHAGLPPEQRKQNQELFLSERVQVVVATVAFGMGIDRPDVRFVVHASLPKGLEQFSQETGRAGRDGLASECVMLYSASDFYGWRSLMERSAAEAVAEGASGDPGGDLEQSIARLSRMLAFATGAVCRHRFLVEHFGQAYEPRAPEASDGQDSQEAGSCGACDVCLGELPCVEDSLTLAQMILSCVVRCEQRYGAAHIADVLRGADTERLRQARHDQLSTYGLLKDHTAREIRHWIEQLVGLDHLGVAPGPYPTLHLSQTGVRVMKGELEITLFRLPHKTGAGRGGRKARKSLAQVAAEEGAPPPDEALFEKLRALRRKLASERGVPPYVIFNDRTLSLMSGLKPTNERELLAVKGVGEKKAADLGATFLAAIAAHAS